MRFYNGYYDDRLTIAAVTCVAVGGLFYGLAAHANFIDAEALSRQPEVNHVNTIAEVEAIGSGVFELTAGVSAAIVVSRRRIINNG